MELVKARAALEDKLKMLNFVEAAMQGAAQEPTVQAATLPWQLGPAMPSRAEAVVAAVLLLHSKPQHELAAFVATVLEAAAAFDALGEGFTLAAAGWDARSALIQDAWASLACVDEAVLRACLHALQQLLGAMPSIADLRVYLERLRGLRGRQLNGPARDAKGNCTLRRALVLVPAARQLQVHAPRMRMWLSSAASDPPAAGEVDEAELRKRLETASAERDAATRGATVQRCRLKALQAHISSDVKRRVDLHSVKVERKVRCS